MNEEQENMWRTLKDEPHVASRWCSVGWHRWSKWERKFVGDNHGYWFSSANWRWYVSERHCVGCGVICRKKEKLPWERDKWVSDPPP